MKLSHLTLTVFGIITFLGTGIAISSAQVPTKKMLKADTTKQDKTSVRNQHNLKNYDTLSRKKSQGEKGKPRNKDRYLVPDTTKGKNKK